MRMVLSSILGSLSSFKALAELPDLDFLSLIISALVSEKNADSEPEKSAERISKTIRNANPKNEELVNGRKISACANAIAEGGILASKINRFGSSPKINLL